VYPRPSQVTQTGSGLALLLRALEEAGKRPKRTGEKRWPQWKALCPCHDDHTPSLNIDYKVASQHDPVLDGPEPQVWCRICKANRTAVCKALGLPEGRVKLGNDQWNDELMGEPPPPARLPSPATLVAYSRRLLVMPELEYLKEQRGIDKGTVERHCIGWDFYRYTLPVFQDGTLVNVRRYKPDATEDEGR
jgi:hypothetical protein